MNHVRIRRQGPEDDEAWLAETMDEGDVIGRADKREELMDLLRVLYPGGFTAHYHVPRDRGWIG